MDEPDRSPTWVEVDLQVIENNVRFFLERTDAQVMAVVKADGYGHGAVPVAQAALRAGAAWCGVARLSEALELRDGGLVCPILLLGLTTKAEMEAAVRAGISMTVWREGQIEAAAQIARRLGLRAKLHLKLDTGMSRLGVDASQASGLAKSLRNRAEVQFEGVFTHFAKADENDPGPTDRQARRFQHALQRMQDEGVRPPLVHAANSAATLRRLGLHFDLVRVGIALYGLHPSAETRLPSELKPALTWKAQLSQVKQLPPGRGVSYGHVYTTDREERIGTLPVGYADGLRRTLDNVVLVRGRRVPVVGRVCMDQCMVQLDAVPEAEAGEEVVLIGRQGNVHIFAEEVAQRWGTINYEVVCGIGARVPRVYTPAP